MTKCPFKDILDHWLITPPMGHLREITLFDILFIIDKGPNIMKLRG